jgi:hypothetical protein
MWIHLRQLARRIHLPLRGRRWPDAEANRARLFVRPPGSAAKRSDRMHGLSATVRALGPYAAIALILPGGSLIVLGLWTVQHRARIAASLPRLLVIVAALGVALILPGRM